MSAEKDKEDEGGGEKNRLTFISYEKSQELSSRKLDLFYFLPKILKLL